MGLIKEGIQEETDFPRNKGTESHGKDNFNKEDTEWDSGNWPTGDSKKTDQIGLAWISVFEDVDSIFGDLIGSAEGFANRMLFVLLVLEILMQNQSNFELMDFLVDFYSTFDFLRFLQYLNLGKRK